MNVILNGAQVQTLGNLVVYGDRVTLTGWEANPLGGPDGTVIVDWENVRKQVAIDPFGSFTWRYV